MQRVPVAPRRLEDTAIQHGFDFHSIDGDPYWDESAYYQFTLKQIENDLEDPVEELENLCFSVVERAVVDREILERLAIPETYWDMSPIAGGTRRKIFTAGWISVIAEPGLPNFSNITPIRRPRCTNHPSSNGFGSNRPWNAAWSPIDAINSTRFMSELWSALAVRH